MDRDRNAGSGVSSHRPIFSRAFRGLPWLLLIAACGAQPPPRVQHPPATPAAASPVPAAEHPSARSSSDALRVPWLPELALTGGLSPDPARERTATQVPFVGRGDIAAIVERFVTLVRSNHAVVLDDVRERAVGIVVFERDGVRTRLEVERREGTAVAGLARLVPVPSVSLPGACVPIPARSYAGRSHGYGVNGDGEPMEHEGEWHDATKRGPDLDGDGRPDVLVPFPGEPAGYCADDLSWEVYVRRGDCGHLVGRVGPGTVSVDPAAAPGPAGLLDLGTSRRDFGHDGPIPSLVTEGRLFRFDGRQYVLVRETRQGGQCHHCLSIHCTPP